MVAVNCWLHQKYTTITLPVIQHYTDCHHGTIVSVDYLDVLGLFGLWYSGNTHIYLTSSFYCEMLLISGLPLGPLIPDTCVERQDPGDQRVKAGLVFSQWPENCGDCLETGDLCRMWYRFEILVMAHWLSVDVGVWHTVASQTAGNLPIGP